MPDSRKIACSLLAVIALALLLVMLLIAPRAYQAWIQRPLGPTLAYATEWRLPATWTASPGPPSPTAAPSSTSRPETETPTQPPFLACRGLPGMTILAIGSDVRSSEYRYGRADVIRAVRVDFQAQRVTALEFPRDLWVKIPGIEHNLKTDHQKLNTAYVYGNPGYGPSLLARTLDLNFGLKVDHYIVVNMNVFVDFIDALGGLDITIPPGGIDGRTSSDRSERLVFPEGRQHLTGEQALTLARIRNISVFERAKHQNLVMCALQREVEQPEVLLKLPALIDSFLKNIQTDLSPEQISQLACLGTQMPSKNIVFTSFPLWIFKPDEVFDPVLKQDVFIWDADFGTLRGYVADFQEGTWPSSTALVTPEPGTSSCE